MTINPIYMGGVEPDVAHLHVAGVTYRCFVYRNIGRARIEAYVMIKGEDGQMIHAQSAIIATPTLNSLDSPRVLGVDNTFVVHWIDYDGAGPPPISSIFRATFDVTDFPGGWTNQGSITTHTTNQYDHSKVFNSSPEEFIVSHRSAAGTIFTARYESPYAWTDIVWSNSDAGLTIADTVLGCYADDTEGDALVCYQDTLTLQVFRRDSDDGLNLQGPNEVFADLDSGDNHFTAVGMTCPAGNAFVIVAEAADSADITAGGNRDYARMLAWRQVRGSTATAQHESQWRYNLHMLSKPWQWLDGDTSETEVYVACSFKSVADGQEFDQIYGYVVRLAYDELAGANAAGVIAPVPVSALMSGTVDARPHGSSPVVTNISIGSRMNHLSHAIEPPQYDLGPDTSATTFAYIRFARLFASVDNGDTELVPIQAGIGYCEFLPQDVWARRDDEKQVAQPDTPNWTGVNNRPMALTIETAAGLIHSGGITGTFDGEQMVELGFLHTPEIMSATATGGGQMDDAETYFWYCNYAWSDARGQLHRSPPSRPVTATLAVNEFVELEVRPCALSMKDDLVRYPNAGPINIEVWRTYTDSGGAIVINGNAGTSTASYLFRREFTSDVASGSMLQDTPVSDFSDFSQTIAAGRPNSEVRFAELSPFQLNLQTLQWSPPPPTPHRPLTVIASWLNRLWGVDPEDDRVIWYSEEILPLGTQYVMPEFPDTNVFRFDGYGSITALQPMDSQLIIFTKDGLFALSGLPASGGQGASLNLSVLPQGTGCIEPKSVVLTNEGIFFQSAKGIHRLTRGTGVEYIGAPIEDLIRGAGNIRSAENFENRHEVRFSLQALSGASPLEVRPRLAVYNYKFGVWTVRNMPLLASAAATNRLNEMQDATAWRGLQGETLHVVLATGGLAIERADDDTVYADEGAGGLQAIPLDVTTEWVHLAGIAGLKRLKEIGIQTQRTHAGEMTIEAWFDVLGDFDGSGAPDQTRVYASPAPDYLRFRPNVEKLSGIRLRIYESGTVAQTENVRLVSMTVRYAAKQTHRRVANAS